MCARARLKLALMKRTVGSCGYVEGVTAVLDVSELLDQPGPRRNTGEPDEFTAQVGLVVIPGIGGDACQVDSAVAPHRVGDTPPDLVKPHQHRDRLRGVADLSREQRAQMAGADSDPVDKT